MQLSQRSWFGIAALVFLLIAVVQVQPQAQAQQPEPLKITAPDSPRQAEPPAPRQEPPAAPRQAEPPAQAQVQTAQGELLDVDAKGNTLNIKTATSEMTFKYNESTKVSGAQKGVAGLATMTGSQVTVQYRKDGAANLATSIEIRPEKK
jgi:hypothetical protein